MTTNHALFFIFSGPRPGQEASSIELHNALQAFWTRCKEAKDIAHFENVLLASTGNQSMPAAFILVTGERSKLQKLRWENEEFLKLHAQTMMTMTGYACIDGYAGQGYDDHMKRLTENMSR